MTVQIITATIDKIERKIAKTGDPGCSIVLKYDDGSEWGKSIYQWLWMGDDLRDNQKIDIKQWAALVDCPADLSSAKKLIAGESWELIGVEVDLQVDTTPKFWKIINFSKGGTLQQLNHASDEIPF